MRNGGARIVRVLVAAALGLLLALPVEAADPPAGHATPGISSGFSAGMHAAMEQMARDVHAAPMTGDPDVDFLLMMIPHHEAAVEMARLVLIHGRDPLVRRLAEDILAAQQAEIATMTQRLRTLRRAPDPDPGGYPALGGTRGPGR
jgi:hypothetical protein